jgi:hypothetical protein
MRMSRLVPLAVVLSVAAVSLTGCIAGTTSTPAPTSSGKASNAAPAGYAIPKVMKGEVARATFKPGGEASQTLESPGLFNHIYTVYTACKATNPAHKVMWEVTIDQKFIVGGKTTCDGTAVKAAGPKITGGTSVQVDFSDTPEDLTNAYAVVAP